MTQRTKDLLAKLERELETLSEAEQEAYVGALLEDLRRRKQDQNEKKKQQLIPPSTSFKNLRSRGFLPTILSGSTTLSMELTTNVLFLDASFAIALVSTRDEHHGAAVAAADQYASHPHVTTRPVLLEIRNALSGIGHRDVAASYLAAVEEEPSTEIVPLSVDLFRHGFDLYRERPDKSWGLTDCISFVVMRDRDIRSALTADGDFEQAGFRALLGE